jgi:hypothetical protein
MREGRLTEAAALCGRAVAASTAALGFDHPHAAAARALAHSIDGARARATGPERLSAVPQQRS